MAAAGKSTREIAALTGLGKSTVSRYCASAPVPNADTIELLISDDSVEKGMSIDSGSARNFLADLGVAAPAPELPSMPPPILKNNPKALKLAERLMSPRRQRQLPESLPLPQQIQAIQAVQLPPPEPVESPANLIAQIQLNVNHFEPVLKDIIVPDKATFIERLYKKNGTELYTLLKVIDRARLLGNLSNQFKHMFWAGSSALEQATKLVGLKTDGLTVSLKQQREEVESILKELAMNRIDAWSGSQSPEMRLAYLVSATMLSVDTMNRMKSLREVPTETDKPANEKLTAKFADL